MSSDTTSHSTDDFEDLLVNSRSAEPKPPGGKGRRGVAAALAVSLLALLVLGLAWALARPAPGAEQHQTTADQAAQLPPEQPATQPQPGAEPGAATDPSSRDWPVPSSAKHGPRRWSPAQASGFSRTPAGAALAAANIAGRLDPYRGPGTYRPTLARQTLGHTREIRHLTEASYQQAAKTLGLRNGQPIPPSAAAPAAPVVGWQATGCRDACVVQLLTPWKDTHVVHEVPVVWRDGDWRVRLTSPSQLFNRRDDVDPSGFQPFNQ